MPRSERGQAPQYTMRTLGAPKDRTADRRLTRRGPPGAPQTRVLPPPFLYEPTCLPDLGTALHGAPARAALVPLIWFLDGSIPVGSHLLPLPRQLVPLVGRCCPSARHRLAQSRPEPRSRSSAPMTKAHRTVCVSPPASADPELTNVISVSSRLGYGLLRERRRRGGGVGSSNAVAAAFSGRRSFSDRAQLLAAAVRPGHGRRAGDRLALSQLFVL